MIKLNQHSTAPFLTLISHEAELSSEVMSCACDELERFFEINKAGYYPDNDGYVVIITKETTDRNALEENLGLSWLDAEWEDVTYNDDYKCFIAMHLFGNQFVLIVIVEDAEWVDEILPGLRSKLHEYTV
jgi:hypothetical protein